MAVLSITGLKTSVVYNAQVRAITAAGGTSQWSPTFSFTTVADTIPPNTPSTPVCVPYLGQIKVEWDGLDALEEPMPKDFNVIEVHSSTTSGFTPDSLAGTLVGTMIGAGSFVHTDLIYGTTYYYRLVAVDRTGNFSPVASGQASATPEQVVGGDILDGAVGSLKLADLAVVNAKIGDLAVNDAKIANLNGGKIVAASIQTDKIAVGVIRTNLPTNASFEDTTVPGAIGTFFSLPGWTFINNGGSRVGQQDVNSPFVPPVSGRGKVTLGASSGSAGSSVESDAFPLNSGDTYNWSILTGGYGRLTARFQTSVDKVTWTDRPNSMIEAEDIIGTEQNVFDIHSTVVAASVVNGTLATAFANGQTVDGVVLATGNRILLAAQTNAAENGIYTVNASGAPTRATDADGSGEIEPGTGVYVSSGTVNGGYFLYVSSITDTSNVVTNKQLTSNVATITTVAAHGYTTGQLVQVFGVDVTFNGTWVITGTPTATTFTYAVTAANVSSTASSGTTLAAWIAGVGTTWISIPYLHRSVRACSQVPGTLASSFANGQVVDGVTLVTGDRILLANQANGAENGIYTVNASGAPTRAIDANASGEMALGHTLHVREGNNSGGSYLIVLTSTSTPWVPGTDSLGFFPASNWNKISGQWTAPGGIAYGRIILTNANTNAFGDSLLYLDDVLVMENNATGSEITSAGIRLFNGDGAETVRITGAPTGGTFINITSYDSASHASTTLASISDTGGGTFTSMDVDTLTIAGQDISSYIGNNIIAWGQRLTACPDQAAEQKYMELQVNLNPGRIYRVYTDPFFLAGAGGTYGTGISTLKYTNNGTAVGTGSTALAQVRLSNSGQAETTFLSRILDTGAQSGVQEWRFLVTCNGEVGSTAHIVASSGYPFSMYVEDLGASDPSIGDIGIDWGTAPGGTTKKSYLTYWHSTWSSSYFGSGSKNTYWGTNCVQGYYSSGNGNQKAMIGFTGNSYSGETGKTITTALSGATVTKVEVYLYNYHWYYGAGGTAVIGVHPSTATSAPATFSANAARLNVGSWGVGAAKWVTIPNTVGAFSSWVSGGIRGVVLGPGPSTSQSYYGGFYGVAGPNPPILRITYTK